MVFLKEFAPRKAERRPPQTYLKKTVLRSSVVVKFLPDFLVCTNKPLKGLASTSVNDEADQTLHSRDQDSYFSSDLGDDDVMMLGLDAENETDPLVFQVPAAEFQAVDIVVRLTSLVIDGVEFGLNSAVSDVVLLQGARGTDPSEDSLLVSLKSGFLLLIRIWKVSRTFLGAGYASDALQLPAPILYVYKPFVVQWWRLNDQRPLEMTGTALYSHDSGLAVVSVSPQSLFRIYTPENTDLGIAFKPHFNVPVDGVILHSCFAKPYETLDAISQILFLTLTLTDEKRLVLTLHSWFVADLLFQNIQKSSLPLMNLFTWPIMVIPLAVNSSFLLVCPDEFVIITAHNIWSADYSFHKFAYDGSFPTAYYRPPKDEDDDSRGDEFFLASDSGVIYLIGVASNESLEIRPFLRINEAISEFTLKSLQPRSGFVLEYSCDGGASKRLYFPHELLSLISSLLAAEKIPYSEGVLLYDYKGWTPIVDFALVDSPQHPIMSQQKLALTGSGKRTRLTLFQLGYCIHKDTRCYSALRKNKTIFSFNLGERLFLVCSLSAGSSLIEYSPTEMEDDAGAADALTEIESNHFESQMPTLCCGVVEEKDIMYQFVASGVLFSDFDSSRFESFGVKRLICAKVVGDLAALIFETDSMLSLKLFKMEVSGLEEEPTTLFFQPITDTSIEQNFSSFEVSRLGDTLLLFLGFFDGSVGIVQTNFQTGANTSTSFIVTETLESKILDVDCCVPSSFAYVPHLHTLFVGTINGSVLSFTLSNDLRVNFKRIHELGTDSVYLHSSVNDPNFLLASSTTLFLYNFYASEDPQLASFNDRVDRNIVMFAELPLTQAPYLPFAFLRDDGVIIGSIFTHITTLVKQVMIGVAAKKFVFFDVAGTFIILCKAKDPSGRLCFVDQKTFKSLQCDHTSSAPESEESSLVFADDEHPLCMHVWNIRRQDRTSKKLIVGCESENGGTLKVIDVRRKHLQDHTVAIEITELYSLQHNRPVTSICQIGSAIYFSSENTVYSTEYSMESKKFGDLGKVADMPSPVISISAQHGKLQVNTLRDSVFLFDKSSGSSALNVVYNDPVPRSLVNHFQLDSRMVLGDKLRSSMLVVDTNLSSRMANYCYQLLFIPRVFLASADASYDCGVENTMLILCVGVSGDFVMFSLVGNEDASFKDLSNRLEQKYHLRPGAPVQDFMDRLNRPFVGKLTGKGLHSLNRPFFDYSDNQGKVIDLDIDEIAVLGILKA
ncbi:hypothetical protein PUMCH_005143 [Australozyma saopauloensis]|uniref:Cleavage/polyadenylation specificity factor A subunit N-terminal domain-containing protein n=1 Tax=Australozyma saopauloensis TaxID=291208 RepID=A0AAX4HGW9_9ASCO|nr:hypothetical protein PUMCH_005143 [[Candida] saopauloensis]